MWEQFDTIFRQSAARIATGIADFLPSLLAFLAVLLLTILAASAARFAMTRFLRRIDFDERLSQWGFSEIREWTPYFQMRSPSVLRQ